MAKPNYAYQKREKELAKKKKKEEKRKQKALAAEARNTEQQPDLDTPVDIEGS